MPWNLGEKLFPSTSPWDRRRMMTVIGFTIAGSIVLIAGVALIIVAVSRRHPFR